MWPMSGASSPASSMARVHAHGRARAPGDGGGDVVGVGSTGRSGQLAVDVGAAGHGMLPLLEDQGAGPLGDHEAVAPDVERP